jgi:hypothetical protein
MRSAKPGWVGRLLVAALLLTGCAGGPDAPRPVALADLVVEQDRYDGQLVVTEGTVRTYDRPRHYWIEDDAVNRVELVPPEAAADHVGARVRVRGSFTFRDDEGRRITVEQLEILEEAAQASTRRPPRAWASRPAHPVPLRRVHLFDHLRRHLDVVGPPSSLRAERQRPQGVVL